MKRVFKLTPNLMDVFSYRDLAGDQSGPTFTPAQQASRFDHIESALDVGSGLPMALVAVLKQDGSYPAFEELIRLFLPGGHGRGARRRK